MKASIILWRHHTDARGRHPVRLRVQVGQRKSYLSTGLYSTERDFDVRRGRLKPSHHGHLAGNRRIAELLERAERIYLERRCSARAVVDAMRTQASGDLHADAMAWIEGRDISPQTRLTWSHIVLQFTRWHKGTLQDVEAAVVSSWMDAMRKGGLKASTIGTRVKMLGVIMRGIGYTGTMPKVSRGEAASHRFLTPEQVARLASVELSGMAATARDLWMFSYYCGGVRIGDVLTMRHDAVRDGWLSYRARKTGREMVVPVPSEAMKIWRRYRNKPYRFGVITTDTVRAIKTATVRVNEGLKVAARAADLPTGLSTHWARHSFASVTVEKGIHPEVAMQMAG